MTINLWSLPDIEHCLGAETCEFQSSNSEDEECVKPKKVKSGKRGLRGFASRKNVTAATEHTSVSGFYTGCVQKCFRKIHSHKEEMKVALQDQDVEDDLLEKCKKKNTPPRLCSTDNLVISDEDDEVNCNILRNSQESENMNALLSPPPPPSPFKGAKGKIKTTKQRKNLLSAVDNFTRSSSDAQMDLLISKKLETPEPVVCILDDEVTVRLQLRGIIKRFTIGPNDPFSTVVSQIAARENVTDSMVMLALRDQTIQHSETPSTIKLHIADIIECHIVQSADDSFNNSHEVEDEDVIELVLQSQSSKHKELVKTHKKKPLSELIEEYSRRVQKDLSVLKFFCDGEEISPEDTGESLDLEDGDVIDVKEVDASLPRCSKTYNSAPVDVIVL